MPGRCGSPRAAGGAAGKLGRGGGEPGSAVCRAVSAFLSGVTERTYVNVNKIHRPFGLAFRQSVNTLLRLFLQVVCNMECKEVKSHNLGALINSLH